MINTQKNKSRYTCTTPLKDELGSMYRGRDSHIGVTPCENVFHTRQPVVAVLLSRRLQVWRLRKAMRNIFAFEALRNIPGT
jgi:hypothetical protein